MALTLFVVFGILLVLNVPVAFALGLAGFAALLWQGQYPLAIVDQRMFTAFDSFPLMAIPFYILAGGLMDSGGISTRIVRFASTLVGHFRGGLAMVAIVSCMFFSGVSGSAVADAAAIGAALIPAMSRRNYDPAFSASLVASSAVMGPIIPPSIPMVLYGVLAGVSIADLFLAGILPGLVIAVALMIVCYWEAVRKNYPREPRATWGEFFAVGRDAFWALIMPVIILGGILSGVFTPTEAGVAAVVYAWAIGTFVYRDLEWAHIRGVLKYTVAGTAVVMFLVATSTLFAWLMTVERIPQMIAETMMGWTTNVVVQLMLINVFLLVLGTILDVAPALILAVPVLLPLVKHLGLDPVHFGMIMITNLVVGLITPPVAPTLVIAANIAKISLDRVTAAVWKFLITLIVVLLLVTYIPALSTWLPGLFKD
jgi:C4-dicarboxylate transporter DctM subunit